NAANLSRQCRRFLSTGFVRDALMTSKTPPAPDAFEALVASVQSASPPVTFGGGTIERQSISEQVATRIIEMIRSGNLKTGDRLPTELQMCVAFGISRPPLREALKALTIMGLLESRQGGRY